MNQGIKFYKTYDLKKISECHQSIGPKTLTPNSRLDRWSGVHNAISDWLLNEANDEVAIKAAEENFQFYDPLQRKLCLNFLSDLEVWFLNHYLRSILIFTDKKS